MGFIFDIDKTVAVAAHLSKKFAPGGIGVSTFLLLKAMYEAERIALAEWRRPITGDSFASMKEGPILSRTYSLMKNEVMKTNSDMVKWARHFAPRMGYYLSLKEEPEYDYLSNQELEALDKAFETISSLEKSHGPIAEILHERWPEWKNPEPCGKKVMPLTLGEVLSALIHDEVELGSILEEIKAVASAKAALQIG